MSDNEDSPHQNNQTKKQLQLQRNQATTFSTRSGGSTHPLTPLQEATEAEEGAEDDSAAGTPLVSRKSLMGRVKLRVSNILPSSWFSPTSKAALEAEQEQQEQQQQQQQQQQNGTGTTGTTSLTKRKRGRRRIELAEPDGEDSPAGGLLPDVDDGAAARGLDYEEVALADNIAEHDLVAEDEQTRRSEYNVFLLRKRRAAIAADDDFDEDDDDVGDGDEEEEEDDDGPAQASISAPTKRRRVELEISVNLPSMRRLPLPLVSSTPAAVASGGQLFTSGNSQVVEGTRSHSRGSNPGGVAPHRRTHLNLYHQRQHRESGYNFFAGNETAAEATTGDLPVSIRRSLNIPAIEHPRSRSFSFGQTQTSSNLSAMPLANHKRPPLLVGQTATARETCRDVVQSENERIERLLNICKSNNNISSSNNNNIIKSKRGAATATGASGAADLESELNEYPEGVEGGDSYPYHHNSNSNLSFYGNLQSAKSIFTRGSAQPPHHNSTCSLNSLNKRQRFNASIYGSSSALSDSRLLTRSASASACGSGSTSSSPFYKGQTTFGGNSAHNRIFGQSAVGGGSSSSLAMNSGGSSPAAHQVTSAVGSPANAGYGGMKPLAMQPSSNQPIIKQPEITNESVVDSMSLSSTTRRILSLLESYSTPLIDVKRLGNTLKEQQQLQRSTSNPYSRPNRSMLHTDQQQQQQNQQQQQPQSLLAPTMQHILERRRLHRVSQCSKDLLLNYKPNASSAGGSTSMALAALPARHTNNNNNNSHTNKMRSRLSHQSARKEPREDTELAPEPLDLPTINFPAMANTPTFDLVIKPPPPTMPLVAANTTADLQMRPKPPQTAFPMPAVNFVCANVNSGAAAPATAAAHAAFQPSSVSGRGFDFGEPIPILEESARIQGGTAHQTRITRDFSFTEPASLERQQQQQQQESLPFMNGPTTAAAAHNPSSSQQQVSSVFTLGVGVEGGFSQQFKKSATEWECDVCMIRNKSELVKCAACETPKPSKTTLPAAAPVPATVPFTGASGFGDRFKKSSSAWECDTCMVSNKNEANKCVACETPRPGAATAASKTTTTTDCFSITNSPGCGSGSGSGFGSGFSTSSSSSGFGQAFRPKANTWECQTCLVMNQTTAVECVACQSRNPNASSESSSSSSTSNPPTNVSSSTSSSSNITSFKFGFPPEQQQQKQQQQQTGVKQDAGFQHLVAAQKAASWECETCMAMNDQSLSKCCCCEQLRPGADDCKSSSNATHPVPTFTFGFVPKAKEAAPVQPVLSVQPAAVLSTSNIAAPQFSFGFGQSKDVADSKNASMGGFKFGAPATTTSSQEEAKSIDLRAMPTATKATSTTGTETAAVVPAAAPPSQFSFRAPTTTTSTVLSSSSDASIAPATGTGTAAAAATVTSQVFSFGAPSSLPSSSSAVSSSTHTSGSNSSATSVISSNVKPMFSFSAAVSASGSATPSGVSSSTSQQPTVTTASVGFFGAGTTTNPGGPATTTSTSFAATPAPALVPAAASAAAPTPAAGLFSFGSASSASSTTKLAPSSNSSTFFFGQTPTSTAAPSSNATTSIFGAAVTSVASGNNNSTSISFSSSTNAASTAAPAAAAAPTPVTFSFGEKRAASGAPANSLTKPVSFGWPSPSASASPIPSNGSIAPATATATDSSSTTTNLPTVVSSNSVFGSGFGSAFGSTSTASTPASTPAAATSAFGGNGAHPSTGFGFAGNSIASQSSPAPAPSSGPAPIFNNAIAPAFGGSNGGGGGGFGGGSNATAAKPAFNFGGSSALSQSAGTSGPFNFGGGGGTGANATSTKPAFNFTGSATVSAAAATPQATTTFNFSASSAIANPLASGDSTPNANAPFQFSAGAPAPANMFAFNPPPAGNAAQNSQMVRRKMRAPVRRLPPR
ncbi:LOW QUALITY PROTEIN: nuclear pore complex protein Nup153 [Drosophila obscura]|uniref:LOW QUALITY PROTEIN: nuclear pore complex protein Nup153 n=1 Tax=Drosophila obscura TaxID=7282 RepID=UPI001BB24222|nr:LOW QUALITY PROTEIN: nuclear pore complex protein Nup153 [Drosophila obscura]